MRSNVEIFRSAAHSIMTGWVQGNHENEQGQCCLVQALRSACSVGGTEPLTGSAEYVLHHELLRLFPSYRLLSTVAPSGATKLDVMMLWNDSPWAYQQLIVDTLNWLADSLELIRRKDDLAWMTGKLSELTDRSSLLRHELDFQGEPRQRFGRPVASCVQRHRARRQLARLNELMDTFWWRITAIEGIKVY